MEKRLEDSDEDKQSEMTKLTHDTKLDEMTVVSRIQKFNPENHLALHVEPPTPKTQSDRVIQVEDSSHEYEESKTFLDNFDD